MRIFPLKIRVATPFFALWISLALTPLRPTMAQLEEGACTLGEIDVCYEKAVQFYRGRDFAAAKGLLEQIIGLDVGYKRAASYLKKTRRELARQATEQEKKVQELAKKRQREEELEAKRLAEESLRQEREDAEQQKKEKEFLAETKEVMIDRGTYPIETEGPPVVAYQIGVGDVLDISVWRISDLDKTVIVRPDGLISYPLVGDAPAAGLTLTELDDHLTVALKEFVRTPEVSVSIRQFGGTKVIVLGEVKDPGVYSVPGGGNIMEVIALARGFTNDAVKHKSFLVRGGIEQPQVFALNLARIFKGDLSQNISLASNDIVYVPKKNIANFNYVITQITPLLSNTLLGTSVYRDLRSLP